MAYASSSTLWMVAVEEEEEEDDEVDWWRAGEGEGDFFDRFRGASVVPEEVEPPAMST